MIQGLPALERRFVALKDHRKLMGQLAGLAVAHAQILAPVKTGNLRRTIHIGRVTEDSAEIVAGAAYAVFVERGTKGGTIIRPRHKKVLAWGGPRRLSGSLRKGGKATNFSMRVRRGATRAQPFLLPGARAAVAEAGLISEVIRPWNEAA